MPASWALKEIWVDLDVGGLKSARDLSVLRDGEVTRRAARE